MPNKEPEDGRCNAKVKHIPDDWDQDVGYCANYEGFRCDKEDAERCYLHGGSTPQGVNEGNTHAETHGLYTERQRYYEERSEEERRWIDAIVESILDDMPETDPSFAKLQMVRNLAIDMHKTQRANEYIDEVGVVHRDKTVGYTDDGRPIKEDQENPLNIAYDRLNKTITKQMKELGALSDPDSQQAEATENLASELSALREARRDEEG